jgi:uncharacterized protein
MSKNVERRFIRNVELRSRSGVSYSSAGILGGYAVRWATNSGNLGGFIERIAPMCFSRSLAKGADVRALINHDPNLLIGRRSTGTLRLNENAHGLAFDCDVADTSYGRDLMKLVARGDMTAMSFAFVAGDTDWDSTTDPDTGQEVPLRTIRSADISDISCVTYPAYETSSVGVRDFDDDDQEDPDQLEYDSRHPVFNSNPMRMFPQGIPREIRSHVPNFKPVVRAPKTMQERRRRLTSFFVG